MHPTTVRTHPTSLQAHVVPYNAAIHTPDLQEPQNRAGKGGPQFYRGPQSVTPKTIHRYVGVGPIIGVES